MNINSSNIGDLIDSITPEVYQNLQRAVELGKWPNGAVIDSEQRQLCMQAVIAYEQRHLEPEQRSGYIPPVPHQHCGTTQGEVVDNDEQPLNFK